MVNALLTSVYNVDMVYTVDIVYTVDMVYTVDLTYNEKPFHTRLLIMSTHFIHVCLVPMLQRERPAEG